MKTLAESFREKYAALPARPLTAGECQTPLRKKCSLCYASVISYETEVRHKQAVIAQFWETLDTGIVPEPLLPSPVGRHYRTVSKRKAFIVNKRFFFGLIGVDDDSLKNYPMDIGRCAIEPDSHAQVYAVIRDALLRKQQSTLVKEFNYVIVKGDDRESIVIFNMNHFSSANRKEVTALSKAITARVPTVQGIFVFVDEDRSGFYLPGNPRKGDRTNPRPLTKLFGREKLFHTAGDLKFLYAPLSFSQTNHSILNSFVATVHEYLSLEKSDVVYDLYCGYGLFSLSAAPHVREVIAAELSRSAVSDGIDNARRNAVTNAKFLCTDISIDTMPRIVKRRPDKIILDPPRNGTGHGVIEFLADTNPSKVVHIFCNTEIIGKELARWKHSGYVPVKARPVDMFPGTGEIEMVVLLEKRGV